MVMSRGSLGGKKLRCYGVRPHPVSGYGAGSSILSQGERKLPPYHPSGFRSRIGVRGRPSIAGMTSGGPD